MMSDERCMKKINVKVTFFLSLIAVVLLTAGILSGRGVCVRSGCMSTRRSGLPLAATREKIYIALILFALFVADLISDRDMRYVMMRKYSSSGMQQGKCFNGLTKSMIPHYPCHRM